MINLFPSKTRSVSTGIEELDLILEGGYPNPGVVLVMGEPSNEKMALAFHFISEGALNNAQPIYLTTDMTPKRINEKANEFGVVWQQENISFIDAYSRTAGLVVHESNIIPIDNPGALNDISLALKRIITSRTSEKPLRVLFHSVSTIALQVGEETTVKFLRVMVARIKALNGTFMILMNDEMHNKPFISALESIADIRMTLRKNKEGIMEIDCSSISDPIPVRVKGGGLEVL
jgi:circadian clock protein KaiC